MTHFSPLYEAKQEAHQKNYENYHGDWNKKGSGLKNKIENFSVGSLFGGAAGICTMFGAAALASPVIAGAGLAIAATGAAGFLASKAIGKLAEMKHAKMDEMIKDAKSVNALEQLPRPGLVDFMSKPTALNGPGLATKGFISPEDLKASEKLLEAGRHAMTPEGFMKFKSKYEEGQKLSNPNAPEVNWFKVSAEIQKPNFVKTVFDHVEYNQNKVNEALAYSANRSKDPLKNPTVDALIGIEQKFRNEQEPKGLFKRMKEAFQDAVFDNGPKAHRKLAL